MAMLKKNYRFILFNSFYPGFEMTLIVEKDFKHNFGVQK